MYAILTAIVPSVGVGILFFIAMRGILRADQKERAAIEQAEKASQKRTGNRHGADPA